MIRDLELTRCILQKMEQRSHAESGHPIEIEERTAEEINYHVMLLNDAGLIAAEDVSSQNALIWLPMHLTWAGHEFLDASRNEARWEKAKFIVENKSGGATFEVFYDLLTQLMRDEVLGDQARRQRGRIRRGLASFLSSFKTRSRKN